MSLTTEDLLYIKKWLDNDDKEWSCPWHTNNCECKFKCKIIFPELNIDKNQDVICPCHLTSIEYVKNRCILILKLANGNPINIKYFNWKILDKLQEDNL